MDGMNEQTTATPALPGAVKKSINKRTIYLAIGLMVFVFLCMAPFWIGAAWWNNESPVSNVAPMPIYANSGEVYVEPESIGYGTEGEAAADCDPDETAIPLYRHGKIAGWGCNK